MCTKLFARTIKCIVLMGVLLSSCDRYEEEFNEIRTEIAQIKDAISALQEAYSSGKIISSVTALEGEDAGGWIITFSDNTSIKLTNGKNGEDGDDGKDGNDGKDGADGKDGVDGKDGIDGKDGADGVTPYLKINEDNFWCVSYDGGVTYALILDSNGEPIPATGKDGQDGEDGKDGVDGEDGKDGQDGNSVRVVVNEEGYFVIEIYVTETDEVVDSITTPYSNSPQTIIQSIVEDTVNNTISITMENGDVFVFDQMVIYPSSIVLLDNEFTLAHCESATIEFIVNPSNAVLTADNFKLNLVRTETRAEVSYINEPEAYSITSVVNATDRDGNTKRGQYIMTIRDNGSALDYSEIITIVIATTDSKGAPMEISSDLVNVSYSRPSSLARVFITTPEGATITSKTEWMKDANIRIIDENGEENLNVTTSIRGRGNTTWTYPKKPYALKLDKKNAVLEMPKHKRWVLLANWMDRTLLRNDIALELARRVMEWAPRGEFVEVYMNGVHQGNYYLCEHIKVDENRVNIDELEEDTDFTDPSQLSGGYILEFDEYASNDEPNYFWSNIIDTDDGTPIAIKEPDEEVITSHDHPAFLYIQNYVHSIEDLLVADQADHARWTELEQLIDVTSYIDWWLVHEMTTNLEPNQPRSCYMYKKRDGKLYAGPAWDFDYRTFNPDYNYFNIKSTMWYPYLFKYPEFVTALKARWAEVEETFIAIDEYIVTTAEKVKESNELNITMWPLSTIVNGDETMTYDAAIERMRAAYQNRLTRVGNNINWM